MEKGENKTIHEKKNEFLKRYQDFGCKDLTELKCSAKKSFEEAKEIWKRKKLV